MSGPVPSPSMNGMIGLSGTTRRPCSRVMAVPVAGGVGALCSRHSVMSDRLGQVPRARRDDSHRNCGKLCGKACVVYRVVTRHSECFSELHHSRASRRSAAFLAATKPRDYTVGSGWFDGWICLMRVACSQRCRSRVGGWPSLSPQDCSRSSPPAQQKRHTRIRSRQDEESGQAARRRRSPPARRSTTRSARQLPRRRRQRRRQDGGAILKPKPSDLTDADWKHGSDRRRNLHPHPRRLQRAPACAATAAEDEDRRHMERGQLLENPRPEAHQVSLKIVVADDLPESALELLRAERAGRSTPEPAAAPPISPRDLADADGLLVRSATKVTTDLLAAAPQLRIVGRAGTGVDNIDVAAASGRGVLVVNAPGANSISVAEHACALMLALARMVPAADQAMKAGKWEKKRFLGNELRGKTLGIAGLGRIGQEVAQRARSFGMRIVAHDPFISREIADGSASSCCRSTSLCAVADYLTLHLPSTPETKHLLQRRAVREGEAGHPHHQHGARRADRRSGAAARDRKRRRRRRRARRVREGAAGGLVARPTAAGRRHAAHRGVDRGSAGTGRPRHRGGRPRFPARRRGAQRGQLSRRSIPTNCSGCSRGSAWPTAWRRSSRRWARRAIEAIALRYYGALAESRAAEILASSAAAGVLRPILSGGVSIVNARAAARERGIEIVESRSTRPRHFTSLVSVKLHTSEGERWAEGTVFEPNSPRLVSVAASTSKRRSPARC